MNRARREIGGDEFYVVVGKNEDVAPAAAHPSLVALAQRARGFGAILT